MFVSERIPNTSTTLWHKQKLQQRNYEALLAEQKRPDYSINQKYSNVKTVWEYNTGFTIGSSAALKENSLFIGDVSGSFYSLSVKDGSVNWKFETENAIYSTPTIEDDYIVFGSADSSVYCLNTDDGNLIWKYKTNAAVLGCPSN